MTIHVNIGDAKTRLSELVAAAERGEEVILARAGTPRVRLVPVESVEAAKRQALAEQRRAAFGYLRDDFAGYDTSIEALRADREDPEERIRRKFELPD